MHDILTRMAENTLGRFTGPMKFRLVLQPVMATFFAVRSGLADAKAGRPPYFWTLLTNPTHRKEMLLDAWKSVGRIFILAVVMDVIYQLIELHTVYPLGALVVAVVLAILPYILIRGVVTRIATRKSARVEPTP